MYALYCRYRDLRRNKCVHNLHVFSTTTIINWENIYCFFFIIELFRKSNRETEENAENMRINVQ